MAHSLEARSPLLDFRLVEFAYSLPNTVKFHRYQRKPLLRRICEKYYPKDLIYRRKGGFSIPLADWLAEERYFKLTLRVLERKSILYDYVNEDAIRAVLKAFRAYPRRHCRKVWLLLWFQIWEGLFVSRCYWPNQKLSEL